MQKKGKIIAPADIQERIENGKATINEVRNECGLYEINSKCANIKLIQLVKND